MTKYCPTCGVELPDGANFCKSCGSSINGTPGAQVPPRPVVEKSHTAAIVIGYITAILIPIIGLIIGIYLFTRSDSENANKHGKYVIIVAVVVWILGIFLVFR